MLDKLRTTMNEARSRAKRFDEYSATLAKLELKRDTCLFKLLDQVRDIAVGVRQLDLPDRRKLLGKDYNVFGGPKELSTRHCVRLPGSGRQEASQIRGGHSPSGRENARWG